MFVIFIFGDDKNFFNENKMANNRNGRNYFLICLNQPRLHTQNIILLSTVAVENSFPSINALIKKYIFGSVDISLYGGINIGTGSN